MRLVLIFNPASGGGRSGRDEVVARAAEALAGLGHRVEIVQTETAGSAGALARKAAEAGADAVFACGGDGTVHEVMQGLVAEGGKLAAALGIVPMGSANALARHLGLSLDPVEAALEQVRGVSAVVSVGKVEFAGESRYFAAMAGAGPDGTLVYELGTAHKAGWGRFAYYLHAARLFATRRFRPFAVEYAEFSTERRVATVAVCAMAVRVASLGGLFGRLTGKRTAYREQWMRLALVRPPGWISLPLWFVCGWLGLETINPLAQIALVSEFFCAPMRGNAPHVEADGEWLGRLPMRVSTVPDALRILLPRRKS